MPHERMNIGRNDALIEARRRERLERIVAGKKLISPVARQRNLDRLARERAEQISRQERWIAQRLVHLAQHDWAEIAGLRQVKPFLAMPRAEGLRGCARGARFVERRLGKADCERLHDIATEK